jgi:prepilin-type N-terminal cleavage/methylation domain-containing protein/prepilin-type processing-associated H-X9-DG protein
MKIRQAFTLIELLVVIAIIAILAAILFPVFAQAKASAKMTADLSNAKQISLGVLMYAADFDDWAPQLDNNGDCIYGDSPCQNPDWGVAMPSTVNPSDRPMFGNVIQPYIKNWQMMYSTDVGKSNWSSIVAQQGAMGLVMQTPYDPKLEDLYYGSLGYYSANIMVVDRWGFLGNLGRVARPAEIVLLAEGVWGNGLETRLVVGNLGVWPGKTNTFNADGSAGTWSQCFNWGEGWTWYPHRSSSRGGTFKNRVSGLTTAAFVDGHVKLVGYNNLERCDFNTAANGWMYTHFDPSY